MRLQTRRVVCHILLCLFFITSPEGVFAADVTVEAQRITSIINKVIDAYGGKEAIEAIRSFRAKGEIEAFMLRDHGTYEVYFKRGRKLRIETRYKRSSENRILNGDRGYRSTDTLPFEEVSGPRYFAMVYQYKHLDILHDLIKGTYEILSVGKAAINGSNAGIFKLTDKEGAIMDVYIDEQNSFIVKVTAYFSSENKKIDLSSEFSDFKKVGDSVFPFRITNYAGGLKVAQTVIDKYSINPDMADSLFEPSIFQSL
jgi:hypothetical protein